LAKQINVLNRWQYTNAEKDGWVSSISGIWMIKTNGRIKFDPDKDKEQLIIGAPKSILNVWMFPPK
jgi:hypothetical protein